MLSKIPTHRFWPRRQQQVKKSMGGRLVLLMKEHTQFLCFGWTFKVCLVFIVLTFTSSMACGGGGGYYPEEEEDDDVIKTDEVPSVNLTGVKDPVERNILAGWNGWEPSAEIKEEWKSFYNDYLKDLEDNGDFPWNYKGDTGRYGTGKFSFKDFAHERGPETGWPDLPGWAGLGVGNGGTPVPPWAYSPKNIGKPTLCYLSPMKGTCTEDVQGEPALRWGYNPYMDMCEQYQWSGCGGTRNKFVTKEKCEKMCMAPIPPQCTADSGIMDTSIKRS